jgi:RNA polymerase sigma-70 factor (ECF subfamily)
LDVTIGGRSRVKIEKAAAQALPAPTAVPRLGPPTGFEDFFRNAYRKLLATAMCMGATREEAEDAVDTGMIEVWRRWDEIKSPLAYARLAVVHAFYKERVKRRQSIGNPADPDELGCGGHLDESGEDTGLSLWEDREWVMQLLRSLPPAQREVMACIVDEFSPAEVARLLGRTPAGVRQNLRAARQHLKQALAE